MALLKFNGVGISGIAACIPRKEIDNYNYSSYFSPEVVGKIIEKIGVRKRRFADYHQCEANSKLHP